MVQVLGIQAAVVPVKNSISLKEKKSVQVSGDASPTCLMKSSAGFASDQEGVAISRRNAAVAAVFGVCGSLGAMLIDKPLAVAAVYTNGGRFVNPEIREKIRKGIEKTKTKSGK